MTGVGGDLEDVVASTNSYFFFNRLTCCDVWPGTRTPNRGTWEGPLTAPVLSSRQGCNSTSSWQLDTGATNKPAAERMTGYWQSLLGRYSCLLLCKGSARDTSISPCWGLALGSPCARVVKQSRMKGTTLMTSCANTGKQCCLWETQRATVLASFSSPKTVRVQNSWWW